MVSEHFLSPLPLYCDIPRISDWKTACLERTYESCLAITGPLRWRSSVSRSWRLKQRTRRSTLRLPTVSIDYLLLSAERRAWSILRDVRSIEAFAYDPLRAPGASPATRAFSTSQMSSSIRRMVHQASWGVHGYDIWVARGRAGESSAEFRIM